MTILVNKYRGGGAERQRWREADTEIKRNKRDRDRQRDRKKVPQHTTHQAFGVVYGILKSPSDRNVSCPYISLR